MVFLERLGKFFGKGSRMADGSEEKKHGNAAPKPGIKSAILGKRWILLILIPLIITFIIHYQPTTLSPLEHSAESNVHNYYRSRILQGVQSSLPNVPDAQKEQIAEKQFQELLNNPEQRKTIDEQVKQASDSLKARLQYQSGGKTYVYLGDIDSYYWLRMSRNILEKGTQCDEIIDKVCYDTYTIAPNKRSKSLDLYPIIIYWIYSLYKPFEKSITLMQASFLTPFILSLIMVIPLFILLRKIAGNIAAVIGSVLVNINPSLVGRIIGSDNDITNVFFQAFFIWFAVECFLAKRPLAKYIWAFLVGMLLSVYSLFWIGWWYLADLFLITVLVKVAYIFIKKLYHTKKIEWKSHKALFIELGITLAAFFASLVIFYGLLFKTIKGLILIFTSQVTGILSGTLGVLNFKVAVNPDYWPNVLTTVAEFNGVGIDSIIRSFGNTFVAGSLAIPAYLIAVLGMLFLIFPSVKFIKRNMMAFIGLLILNIILFYFIKGSSGSLAVFVLVVPILIGLFLHIRSKDDEEFHPDVAFLLTLIICLVTYFSTVGARFIFLMVIPVSIFIALFVAKIIRIAASILKGTFGLPKWSEHAITLVVTLLFLIGPVNAGISTAKNFLPMVDDSWVATLEKIKSESRPDAIINSWWDFGHWFKFYADRRVTLDGSSQNSNQLHWLGKLLLASDENMSIGILRMLDCGANNAFKEVNKVMNDTPHSVDILNKIIVGDKKSASEILSQHGFSQSQISNVLEYSHCSPPENFLITSEDMLGKGGVWAHFGSWDFKKAYLSSAIKNTPEEVLLEKYETDYGIPREAALQWINELKDIDGQNALNAWIAPWPGYISGGQPCTSIGNATFVCTFSQSDQTYPWVVDFNNYVDLINSTGKTYYPKSAAFVEGGSYKVVHGQGNTINLGVVVQKSGDSATAYFMSPELAGSMFTRLFYFEGAGLKQFDKFYDTTSVFGDRIITWKVRWPED